MASDPKLKTGTRICKCPTCGEYFSTPNLFDMHRAGAFSKRRCLDPAKVVDKNKIARLRLDVRGIWHGTRVYGPKDKQ
jgi:hypothetical protein